MHKKFGKHRACDSGDILSDRQTDRHTHTHTQRERERERERETDALITSQYFATALASEVIMIIM